MGKISLAELREKFGPSKHVEPYGDCIIVQGDLFDPDWESYLAKERARCFFGELDGHPVVFVKPRQQLPPGKSEYIPPTSAVKPAAAEPVKATVPASRKLAKMGPDWSDKEMAELLYQFDLLAAQGKAYGASLLLANSSEFSCRSLQAVSARAPKPGDAKYASFEEMWNFAQEGNLSLKGSVEVFYTMATTVGLDGNVLAAMVGVFEKLSEKQCLLAERIDAIDRLLPEFLDIFKLSNRLLMSHKHAQGSGEAVLPMEGT